MMTRSKGSPASICFFTVGSRSHLIATVNPVASFSNRDMSARTAGRTAIAPKPDFPDSWPDLKSVETTFLTFVPGLHSTAARPFYARRPIVSASEANRDPVKSHQSHAENALFKHALTLQLAFRTIDVRAGNCPPFIARNRQGAQRVDRFTASQGQAACRHRCSLSAVRRSATPRSRWRCRSSALRDCPA